MIWRKVTSTTTKEKSKEDKDKNAGTEIVKLKVFHLSSKTLSSYPTKIFLRGLKFAPTPKHNNF